MTLRKYVQVSITASLDFEDPLNDWADTEEEARAIIKEDASELLMDGYADWDVDIRFIEREEDE